MGISSFSIMARNWSLSSARSITAGGVPSIFTPFFSSSEAMPAVMEHIELAGIHSGDSACIIPSVHIPEESVETIKEYTRKIAEEMHVKGLMNMQYAIENGKVFHAYRSIHIFRQAFVVVDHFHASATQHIGRTHHYRDDHRQL